MTKIAAGKLAETYAKKIAQVPTSKGEAQRRQVLIDAIAEELRDDMDHELLNLNELDEGRIVFKDAESGVRYLAAFAGNLRTSVREELGDAVIELNGKIMERLGAPLLQQVGAIKITATEEEEKKMQEDARLHLTSVVLSMMGTFAPNYESEIKGKVMHTDGAVIICGAGKSDKGIALAAVAIGGTTQVLCFNGSKNRLEVLQPDDKKALDEINSEFGLKGDRANPQAVNHPLAVLKSHALLQNLKF